MKIALIGYGRMGQEIEKAALSRNHTIELKFNQDNPPDSATLKPCDVAIDFSWPEAAVSNIMECFRAGVPVVVGTTGWYDQLSKVKDACSKNNGTLLYASNCSLGVNIVFRLNKIMAELLGQHKQYNPSVKEIHHTAKKDAPSGTAITLAEDLINNNAGLKQWKSLEEGVPWTADDETLPVFWKRKGDVKGFHAVTYTSDIDRITLEHEAYSRKGFAIGAVIAAEWLSDKKGLFTMQDLLDQF